MASSAWTANRADLVKALAEARAQRDLAILTAQKEAARAAAAETKAQRQERQRQERRRRHEAEKRATLRRIKAEQDLMRRAVDMEVAVRAARPDPNAELHRRILIAALKEKP